MLRDFLALFMLTLIRLICIFSFVWVTFICYSCQRWQITYGTD